MRCNSFAMCNKMYIKAVHTFPLDPIAKCSHSLMVLLRTIYCILCTSLSSRKNAIYISLIISLFDTLCPSTNFRKQQRHLCNCLYYDGPPLIIKSVWQSTSRSRSRAGSAVHCADFPVSALPKKLNTIWIKLNLNSKLILR